MRCSHYPRDPSFYDACDELGLLLFVEAPSWGWSHTSYSTTFWNRLFGAYREMLVQGNNHPSIIAFGYFNEPYVDFGSYFSQMKSIADSINPLIKKYAAINPNGINYPGNLASLDVCGYQYINPPTDIAVACTEYLAMGNTRGDSAAEAQIADTGWKALKVIQSDGPRSAGGVLWCLKDYLGSMYGTSNQHLGIVDFCFVPKQGYYMYRKNLTGKADDNPVSGTAAKVSLEPDLTYLRADGTDISRIIIAIRDNNGKCITSNASVTLSVSGSSCTLFGPTTVNVVAGKLGIVVRSTESVGATTITAKSSGLSDGAVSISTYAAVEPTGTIPFSNLSMTGAVKQTTILSPLLSMAGNGITYAPLLRGKQVFVYNVSGHLVASSQHYLQSNDFRKFAPGLYLVKVKNVEKN